MAGGSPSSRGDARLHNISKVASGKRGCVTEIDLAGLHDRVSELVGAWQPGARARELRRLEGGRSSLTYLVTLDGAGSTPGPIVVKVAPAGIPATRNRDVLRQARVQD